MSQSIEWLDEYWDLILGSDIIHCPYNPSDEEYREWVRADDERIKLRILARLNGENDEAKRLGFIFP